ncbi:TPA: ATP phosphoribosyltransferase [Candidatus Galligastranaerophilus gallistercoris]|nr:ATP phosphoribosyltransferase [Candidatus Galligastranaerophilus gallistercoris]
MEELKIAIPNKGRLSEKIYELLNAAGLNFEAKSERCLHITTQDKKCSIIFVRTQDIPKFLDAKVAHIGFTGLDIVKEEGIELDVIKRFDFGYCDMVVAVKEEDKYQKTEDLPDTINVATSFPNIAKNYFKQMGKTAKIIEVNGAVEITPSLGLSDVIVDITSSGSTLKQNRLRIIDKIMDSSCVIVQRKDLSDEIKKQISALLTAINAVMDAKEKKYLMVNLPKTKLEELKTFLPGLSSPTVMTLWGDDKNVAVHVVVDKDKIYDSINHLKAIGGEGILILTVDQMVR